MTALPAGFAGRVVRWQQSHGRSGLPWQGSRDPYRVWLSEVMLQQTQVATVLTYFPRFIARFPTVRDLAQASLDDVLAQWSGLGYYSRARNLHRCAQAVVELHGGEFPQRATELETLPGIGRSTAAAIAAFCFGERAAILDANVKRVLARVLGFGADLASATAVRELWDHATALLPARNATDAMPRYTQGLMDLGATVCLPRKPACLLCPVLALCAAARLQRPEDFPVKSRRLKRSSQSLWLLRAERPDGAIWLARRPAPGVWAGLYCLPLFDSRDDLEDAVPVDVRRGLRDAQPFVHVLTHKDLHLHPVAAQLPSDWHAAEGEWVTPARWAGVGLPAPVRKLLERRESD